MLTRSRSNSAGSTQSGRSHTTRAAGRPQDSTPLSPQHTHDTRRRQRLRTLATSLTVVEAANKFKTGAQRAIGREGSATDTATENNVQSLNIEGTSSFADGLAMIQEEDKQQEESHQSLLDEDEGMSQRGEEANLDDDFPAENYPVTGRESGQSSVPRDIQGEGPTHVEPTEKSSNLPSKVKATSTKIVLGCIVFLFGMFVQSLIHRHHVVVLRRRDYQNEAGDSLQHSLDINASFVQSLVQDQVKLLASEYKATLGSLEKKLENLEERVRKSTNTQKSEVERINTELLPVLLKAVEEIQSIASNQERSTTETRSMNEENEILLRETVQNHVTSQKRETGALEQKYEDMDSLVKEISRSVQALDEVMISLRQDVSRTLSRAEKEHGNQLNVEISKLSAISTEYNPSETGIESQLGYLQAQVDKRLAVFAADTIGLADFALASLGSAIERRMLLTSPDFEPSVSSVVKLLEWFGRTHYSSRPAEVAISTDNTPGECWACTLPNCNLTIRLMQSVFVEAVSIDHISKLIAIDIGSAPKKFSVYGIRRLPETDEDESDYEMLGSFEYDAVNGEPVQTFEIPPPQRSYYQWLKFQIHSNHGHKDWTCLYRARVHGSKLTSTENNRFYPED